MITDYYSKVDVSNLTTFTKTDFSPDTFDGQAFDNLSGISVDVSFDGSNVHAVLTTADRKLTYDWHRRGSVWLRRTTGSGGGPLYVEVRAWRQLI